MKSTRILSEGAMISAVTIAVVMMDSLCGGMITMAFPWVYAFPILVFSARRGLRAGALTMFASVLLAFFFTAWTTQYFLFFALLAGLIYGTLVHHESENIWKLLVLFVITTFSNLISMVLLAAVFGYDVSQDLAMYAEVLHFFDANGIVLHLHAVTLLYFSRCAFFFADNQHPCRGVSAPAQNADQKQKDEKYAADKSTALFGNLHHGDLGSIFCAKYAKIKCRYTISAAAVCTLHGCGGCRVRDHYGTWLADLAFRLQVSGRRLYAAGFCPDR